MSLGPTDNSETLSVREVQEQGWITASFGEGEMAFWNSDRSGEISRQELQQREHQNRDTGANSTNEEGLRSMVD